MILCHRIEASYQIDVMDSVLPPNNARGMYYIIERTFTNLPFQISIGEYYMDQQSFSSKDMSWQDHADCRDLADTQIHEPR